MEYSRGGVSLNDELPDVPEGWKPPEHLASAEGLLQGFNPEDHQLALALYRERHQAPIEGLSRRDLDMLPREDLDRLAFRVAARLELDPEERP